MSNFFHQQIPITATPENSLSWEFSKLSTLQFTSGFLSQLIRHFFISISEISRLLSAGERRPLGRRVTNHLHRIRLTERCTDVISACRPCLGGKEEYKLTQNGCNFKLRMQFMYVLGNCCAGNYTKEDKSGVPKELCSPFQIHKCEISLKLYNCYTCLIQHKTAVWLFSLWWQRLW